MTIDVITDHPFYPVIRLTGTVEDRCFTCALPLWHHQNSGGREDDHSASVIKQIVQDRTVYRARGA